MADLAYIDGWHYEVTDGEIGMRVYLEDDGVNYRAARDGDESWHARHHQKHADIIFDDGAPAMRVTKDEMAVVRDFLRHYRGEQ